MRFKGDSMSIRTVGSMWFILLLFVFQTFLAAQETEPVLVLNQPLEVVTELRNFRMMSDPYVRKFEGTAPTREGLSALRASGSAQFSKQSFQKLLGILPAKNVIIIDLRQESHGFLNEMPVSWYVKNNWANIGKDLKWIEQDEAHRLDQLLHTKIARIRQLLHNQLLPSNRDLLIPVHSVSTERELCKAVPVGYLRLPTTDHYPPNNHQIDRFISFVNKLPTDAWIHLHCEGGMGRTTAFLCLYDMMHNAKTVSLEDILKRQWLLGGENFIGKESESYQKWPEQFMLRAKMLTLFYEYCRAAGGSFSQSWTDWLQKDHQSLKSSPR